MTGAIAATVGARTDSVRAEPDPAYGSGSSSTVVSQTVTIQPAASPYAWSQVNGDAMSITAPSSRSTAFSASDMVTFEPKSAMFQCVTSRGTAYVTVYLERTS